MIVRQTFKVGTTGGQPPVVMDYLKIPFQASVNVDIVSGSASYAIEYTTDDIQNTSPSDLRWGTLFASSSESALNGFDKAVTAIRLNLSSITGEVRMTTIQGVGV